MFVTKGKPYIVKQFSGGPAIAEITKRGVKAFPSFVRLEEWFKQKPALNAVNVLADASGGAGPNAAAFAAYTRANKDFEVLGTNMTTALVTFAKSIYNSGGISLTTAGADADQAILLPSLITDQSQWSAANRLNTNNQAGWSGWIKPMPIAKITNIARTSNVVTVTTDVNHGLATGQTVTIVLDKADSDYATQYPMEGTYVLTGGSTTTMTYAQTGADITTAAIAGTCVPALLTKQIIWAGLKLTNTPVVATDDDQCYFRCSTVDTTTPANALTFVTSRANVDIVTNLGMSLIPGQSYFLEIRIDDLRCPHAFVNGYEINLGTGGVPLVAGKTFIPYIGTQASGTTPAAKNIDVMFTSMEHLANTAA